MQKCILEAAHSKLLERKNTDTMEFPSHLLKQKAPLKSAWSCDKFHCQAEFRFGWLHCTQAVGFDSWNHLFLFEKIETKIAKQGNFKLRWLMTCSRV